MTSDEFRYQLRREIEQWQAEGLIDTLQYQRLSERYQLDSLDTSASNRFVTILVGLGGLLLGLGVITFVAANWQAWPRIFKVVLLLAVLVGVNATGFYLWQRSNQWRRLGQALLLLGALSLGANLALMAQMFHISGEPYKLFFVWSLGTLAMAYGLRFVPLGILSLFLMAWGYWSGSWQWSSFGAALPFELILTHLPIVAALAFVPFAYWCRSRPAFGLAALLVVLSLERNLFMSPQPLARATVSAVAYALPPALLWGYQDHLWQRLGLRVGLRQGLRLEQSPAPIQFRPLARRLALFFLGLAFYGLSFHYAWPTQTAEIARDETLQPNNWALLIDIVVFISLAIFEWLKLAQQAEQGSLRWHGAISNSAVIGSFIALGAAVLTWHYALNPIVLFGAFFFNVLLFLLAGGLIRQGLSSAQRLTFWSGVLLLALQVLSRLFEYQTALLLKSFVFVLCGIGVIVAGLWFERYQRTQAEAAVSLTGE
ncbi:DUF2157 domain-containing protein [Leptolyngbya sp. FACHB-261]|uniref:DUF2157 domain-containing protein n=1 Tax=Leptolyngbya sp. FACHB-261 TaxID=2692806 RepID=UPI001681D8F4|nr:DUF2157 domain-containing protein [Leptolyngbya sp. FACHB-261]MBD2101539.1 DUF2157 domain-containing protein [Leptolyngbya sp. FACHB-261]